jgi:hypothetical protein
VGVKTGKESKMHELSLPAWISLFALLALIGVFALLVWVWL